MKILVTGAKGFIGSSLVRLLKRKEYEVLPFDTSNTEEELVSYLKEADFIVHLAGINRPLNVEEFYDGNLNFTAKLLSLIEKYNQKAPILFSSSTQANKDNDYGHSKKMAENLFYPLSKDRKIYVFRFYNVYGKGCRPNYNSVIATWCYNIARDIPISFNEDAPMIDFVYIDDVLDNIIDAIEGKKDVTKDESSILYPEPHDHLSLKEIRDYLYSFRDFSNTLELPKQEGFVKKLYATYLSYLPEEKLITNLNSHVDNRGSFTEALHIPSYGQVSINVSHPGITKGNHYHETKNEKYLCISGSVLIKLRKVGQKEVIEIKADSSHLQLIDIPPGYVHSILTTSKEDSATLMWANEPFDPQNPDTYAEIV